MITRKEDMINTYIIKGDKELLDLFLSKCVEFDIKWSDGTIATDYLPLDSDAVSAGYFHSKSVQLGHCDTDYYEKRDYRKLTASDFIANNKWKPGDEAIKTNGNPFDNLIYACKHPISDMHILIDEVDNDAHILSADEFRKPKTDEEKLIDEISRELSNSKAETTEIVTGYEMFNSDAKWLISKFNITRK